MCHSPGPVYLRIKGKVSTALSLIQYEQQAAFLSSTQHEENEEMLFLLRKKAK